MAEDRLDRYLKGRIKAFKKLPKRVREEIEKQLEWQKSHYTTIVERCESPIEQLIAIHLIELESELYRDSVALENPFDIRFYVQKDVNVNDANYRLDFLIEIAMDSKTHKFAVECDGHDFHEKTKEQARRDKKRDRDLASDGYTVLRFTGSEIHKNPAKCVGEISKIINKTTGIDKMYSLLVEERHNDY
jgi:very-short-patch-repair endonuclease